MTLVEIMVAMLVGSLLIALVMAIYTRMSVAYRTQNVVSDVQQGLRAASDAIAADVRRAGYMVPNGFRVASSLDPNPIAPLSVTNNLDGTGPDSIRVFYADATAVAHVTSIDPGRESATVDDSDVFEVGDLAVIVRPLPPIPSPTGGAVIAQYDACVIQVTDASAPTLIEFVVGSPFNAVANSHCTTLQADTNADSGTMMYRFVGRSYRIDPTAGRLELGILQMSPSGELLPDDWIDMGVGFTDLQFATRFFEDGDGVDLDGDGLGDRDWYSSEAQEEPDATGTRPVNAVVSQVTMSLAARTTQQVSAVTTKQTPAFIDVDAPSNLDHNQIGDSPAQAVSGDFIYRWSTTRIDVRNMGVGR